MNDRVEQLVRDAGDWPVRELDPSAVAARARQRRRRRGTTLTAVAVTLALAVGVAVVAWPDDTDQAVVSTTGRAPDVTWTPLSLPLGTAGLGTSLAGGPQGLIAIGSTGIQEKPTDLQPVPTIWHSTDGGTTWPVAYTDPNVVPADEKGFVQQREASFGASYYLNGMFVVTGTVNLGFGQPSIAAIWTSPDGNTWTQADRAAFRSPVTGKTASESRIYDVTEWQGQLVAVGDLFLDAPKKKQCCGLGVGVWTSRDGITWQQHIADLGDGFDPYITSLTTRGTKLVGGGSVDVRNGVVWATRDLRTWARSTIAENGRGELHRIGRGYIAVGTRGTGPKKKRGSPAEDTGIPTIWWSRDTTNWTETFTLPKREGGRSGNDTSFGGAETVPGLAIAVGPSNGTTSATASNKLYASANGRAWSRLAVPGETTTTRASILGTDATGIYISRYEQSSPNSTAPPSAAWRVVPTRPSISQDVSWNCPGGITPPAVVPDFVGKEFAVAGREACDLGLRVGRAKGHRGDVVYEQSPAAGTPIVTSPLYVDLKAR